MALSPSNFILVGILAVILIRVFLFSLPSFHIDMNGWQAWTVRLVDVGPNNFYSRDFFSDYFPGFLYILWMLGTIYNFLFPALPLNTFLFEIFIKGTTTLFDIGTSFYIYKIVWKYQKSWAIWASLFYLANPAIIFNSSIWGQIDGIFTFFLVLAAYYLIELKKLTKSSIFLAIGIIIKPQSLALLPIVVKKIFDSTSSLNAIKKLLIMPVLLIIISFPFFINDPFLGLLNLGIKAGNVYPYTSLFSFNLWSLFSFWQNDSNLLLGLSYQTWGLILYVLTLLLILFPLFSKKTKESFYFYLTSSLSFFIFYLFLTRVHERYLFPFFAFLLISSFIKKSKILITLYILTSIIHLLNLWYVYYYYNFVYLGLNSENATYNFIDQNYKLFSIALIIIFLFLLAIYYRFLSPTFKPKVLHYLQLLNQK